MLIDWFTAGAQAVNFLILVWLLKRFLYRPVLAAIDSREKKIAAQLANATQREAQARAEREDFQHRSEALDGERQGILRKANDAAAAERQRQLEETRQEAQLLRARLAEALVKEREEISRRLSIQTQTEVFALARKVMAELAHVSVEGRMAEIFMDHLRSLPAEQRRLIGVGATERGTADRTAVVRSAFELAPAQRASIGAVVSDCFGAGFITRFEISSPELVLGLELSINGTKLAWSVIDYLSAISRQVDSLMELARSSATTTQTAQSSTPSTGASTTPQLEVGHG
jgi:F-type H+-transporting ATPase subunit b